VSRRALPVLLAALTLAFTACGGGAADAPTPPQPEPSGGAGVILDGGGGGSGSTGAADTGLDLQHVLTADAAWAAISSVRYLPMYRDPAPKAQPNFVFDTRNPLGKNSPFLVEDAKRMNGKTWLQLLLPIRPNGRAAWVKGSDVRLVPREDRIVVDLSKRMLWRYRDGKLVDSFQVGVGTPSTPTGTGTFYIYLRVPQTDPNGPYGILAYGLSGFSPVISDWPGGGRMAMHGTPFESNKGEAVSHGCVRVYNADLKTMRDLPLGAPVIIRQ
jgi:lipoprotein-anchoring transpeptidase ErfK/SrfK